MLVTIPDKKEQFIQTNRSDTLGNLWATVNCDLWTNLGKLRNTRLLKVVGNDTLVAMTGVPCAFQYYYDTLGGVIRNIFMAATPFIFASVDNHTAFAKFTTYTGYPTDIDSRYSDLGFFNGNLTATASGTNFYYLVSGIGWTTVAAGTTAIKHLLCEYGSSTTSGNRQYMTDNSIVISWDTSYTVASSGSYTLTFDTSSNHLTTAYFLKAASDRIWLGIGPTSGGLGAENYIGRGQILEWDGFSPQPTTTHTLDAGSPLSCVIKDDVPYVMDSNGRLLVWNGGTFKELARLPINDKFLIAPFGGIPFVHPNGMSVIGGKINILVNGLVNDNAGSNMERCPSGVWEYDDKIGLYHKYSLSNTLVAAGNTMTDWGHVKIPSNGNGALTEMKISDTQTSATGRMLVGGSIYTSSAAAAIFLNAVFTDDTYTATSGNFVPVQRVGYFVTSKIPSEEIEDTWQKIYAKYKPLQSASDRMVVKYRTSDISPLDNVSITWVTATTFTCSTSILTGWGAGDEVEILCGSGAGLCAHIISAVDSSGTTTVTIDENYANYASSVGTATARFQHWVKMGNDVTDQVSSWKQFAVAKSSTWIQIKVWMLTTRNDEFEQLLVTSEIHKPAN